MHAALTQLNASGLLRTPLPKADEPISRRQLFNVAATLIPVVASVAVPVTGRPTSLEVNAQVDAWCAKFMPWKLT